MTFLMVASMGMMPFPAALMSLQGVVGYFLLPSGDFPLVAKVAMNFAFPTLRAGRNCG